MTERGVIRTERLILRPLRPEDAKAIAEGIGQWDVIKWLTTPPWPYGLADAEWFLGDPMSAETFGIEIAGEFAGVVGMHPDLHAMGIELGYWLNLRFHGQGYMSEATHAVVSDHFARSAETLVSGYLVGNHASCAVLSKRGFQPTELILRNSRPIGHDVPLQRMVLTHADWLLRKG